MHSVGRYFCLLMVLALTSWAQLGTQHSELRSYPKPTSLLARSEMQVPRPLPIVKPLRFDEIPVGQDRDSIRPGAITPTNEPKPLSITPANPLSNSTIEPIGNTQVGKSQ